MSPTATFQRTPDNLVEVRLQGPFVHPHWVAHFFSNLSELNVAAVSGRAAQAADATWDARLCLDFARTDTAPETVDFAALAQRRAVPKDMSSPALTDFRVCRRPDQQLEVRVEGPDQPAFLGRLLTKFTMLGLFPSELVIDTVGEKIQDRIVLRGITTKAPSENVQRSLEAMCRLMQTAM